ncbi:MAG TPA: hypothetical protein PKH10_04425 [bacterium]|nr:hypothetical protein [bacterium]
MHYCIEIAGNDIDLVNEGDDTVLSEENGLAQDDAESISDYEGVDCDPWVPDGDPYADIESAAMKWHGDFDVVATDPDNIRELWKGIYRYSTDSPDPRLVKPYDRCAKDYPFEPAMVEDENNFPDTYCNTNDPKADIREFPCDTLIGPGRCWAMNWTMGSDPQWYENNGKVIVHLFNPNNTFFVQGEGTYLFDIATRRMTRLAGQSHFINATNGRYAFFSTYDNAKQYNWPEKPEYYAGDKPYSLLTYYDTEENEYGIAYRKGWRGYFSDLRASERYLIATIQDDLTVSGIHVEYTKIGEWDNWKPFTAHSDPSLNRIGPATFHDHYIAFYNWDFVIQYCDLDIGSDSCKVISRYGEQEGKYNRNATLSRDGKRIYYDEGGDGYQNRAGTIIEADITDLNNITYREIAQHYNAIGVHDIDDRFLLFGKQTGLEEGKLSENPHYVACFHRFSDGRNFCLENDHDSDLSGDVSKAVAQLWDKYLVYGNNSGALVLRDMKCYCNAYPDTCPYEEYAPPRKGWKNLFGLIR